MQLRLETAVSEKQREAALGKLGRFAADAQCPSHTLSRVGMPDFSHNNSMYMCVCVRVCVHACMHSCTYVYMT